MRIIALVIGNNNYPDPDKLENAVNDAKSMEDVLSDIYTLRFIKPLDEKHLADIFAHYDGIIFVEDGIKTGGVSEYLSLVCEKNLIHNYAVKAFPEGFYSQGSREDVLEEAGMSVSDLKNTALDLLK